MLPRLTPGPDELIAFEKHVDPLAFLGGLIDRYGDVVSYKTRFGPCFLFTRPSHVKAILHDENYRRTSLVKMMLGEGLLASEGPRWRSQRRIMQKDFLPAALSPFVTAMGPEIEQTCVAWEAAAAAGTPVDIGAAMTELTLRIVVKTLFSEDLTPDECTALSEAVTETITDLGKISWAVFGVPVHFKPERQSCFAKGRGVIDQTCQDMITRRKAAPVGLRPRDLLTLLIEADTSEGAMSDEQLRDEIVTMLVGGHETTALALAWGWKLLAEHPADEKRLHQELDTRLGGRAPERRDADALSWTRAVFQESMRLYPPVWYMARVATEAGSIDGHAIPRGACVLVSAWFTHRHKGCWIDGNDFKPGRYAEMPVEAMERYAFFPFGGGRHQCLGMHFAWMEGVMILAQLAQRFVVRPIDSASVLPLPGITMRHSTALMATVHAREFAATCEANSGRAQ